MLLHRAPVEDKTSTVRPSPARACQAVLTRSKFAPGGTNTISRPRPPRTPSLRKDVGGFWQSKVPLTGALDLRKDGNTLEISGSG